MNQKTNKNKVEKQMVFNIGQLFSQDFSNCIVEKSTYFLMLKVDHDRACYSRCGQNETFSTPAVTSFGYGKKTDPEND